MVESIAELLIARAEDGHTGLIFEDQRWTWAEVVQESVARARALEERDLAGRHIGVLLDNTPEYVFLLGAAALTASVVVGVNHTRRGEALAGDIRHTDCAAVLTDGSNVELLDGLDVGAPVERVDDTGWSDRLAPHHGTQWLDQMPNGEVLYLLIFTSGSTGAPKAVRMTQGRAVAMMAGASSAYSARDVLYSAMPLFHANGLTGSLFPAMGAGATVVLKRRFSASGFLPDVRRHRCTSFNYVGQSLSYILAQPPTDDDADNVLVFCVGAEASPGDRKEFRRRFGCYVVEGYTSSEGGVSINPFRGMPEEALGRPPEGMDLAIVDPDTGVERPRARFGPSRELLNPTEAVGEIVRRDAPGVFEGYYANEAADAKRTRNGWIWTGDLGFRDEAGTFYFAGRGNDWLRVDGENFAAAPVEAILSRHPAVRSSVVFAVPDPLTGDRVMAVLQLPSGADLEPNELASFLEAQPDLGTKWAPHLVRFVDDVPLTGTGKVDRKRLRAERWDTTDTVWWRRGRDLVYEPFTGADAETLRRGFASSGRVGLLS